MSLISIPNTFTVGAVIVASQHNANFSTIYSDYNGNITDANIASNAAISYSKLSLNSSVKDTDLVSGVGTSAGNIIKLNGSAQIPAISGALLTNLPFPSGQLGAWTTKSVTTIYQAATDLFVSCFGTTSGNSSIQILTDSSATPSTTRAQGGAFPGSGSVSLGCSCVVKKSDFYEITTAGSTVSGINIYIIPIGI